VTSYQTCIHCREASPDSEFCPACGRAKKKWCPGCGSWKPAWFRSADFDEAPGRAPTLLAEYAKEARHCSDCGRELQAKGAPHE
jgi:hypothetical protein